MRILYHHRIASKDGQYVHVSELTRALAARGIEIEIVGPPFTKALEFGAQDSIVASLKRRLPKAIFELLEFMYSFLAYRRLCAAVQRHRPDCIYERYSLFTPTGVWVKKRFGLPLLLEVNAPLAEERRRFGGLGLIGLARWSERHVWTNADRVLPVTRVLANEIESVGVPAERITVIPNGARAEIARRADDRGRVREALGLKGKTVLGFVGFMREWHGIERIIEIIAGDRTGGRVGLLVGDGPERPFLEDYANELGISDRVIFTGTVAYEDVAHYIAAFDIALQPDVVPYASPLKVLEYMRQGKAIVAPNTANIREILADKVNARLFAPGDINSFSKVIEELLHDFDTMESLGRRAMQTVVKRRLTWQANAERIEKIIKSLVGASSSLGRNWKGSQDLG